jgi:hypothetical protein
MELRYVTRTSQTGLEKVLQYRKQVEVSDYSSVNTMTGDYVKKKEWTDWKDVPTVKESV